MTAVVVGGWSLVRLVDGRKFFTDPDCAGSLVGPGSLIYLPEAKARWQVARGWAELVNPENNQHSGGTPNAA